MLGRQLGEAADGADRFFHFDDLEEVVEEPAVDFGEIKNLLHRHAAFDGVAQVPNPFGARTGELGADFGVVGPLVVFLIGVPEVRAVGAKTKRADFEAAQCFLKRLLKGAADGHCFADAFHLRGESVVGFGEFFKSETRNLGHDVVDRRLEAGGRFAGDVVGQLVQAVADGQFGGDLGDRKTGRFGGERAGTTHARVHLDDDHPTVVGIGGKLDVGAARLDADLADDGQRGVAHALVLFVRERLGRGDGDGVAGVDAHRVEIFDRADDDDVVVGVAHDLHFVFFPADNRFFDQHFGGRRKVETTEDHVVEFGAVVGDRRAAAAHRKAGADDCGHADLFDQLAGFFDRRDRLASANVEADFAHRCLKPFAAFGFVDNVGVGGDHLDAVLFKDAMLVEIHRQIEAGLAAERREERVGPFGCDHLFDHLPGERLDVGPIGGGRIGHDRRRVGVDENDLVAFLAQRFARLGAGVVELAGLADDDRAGANK